MQGYILLAYPLHPYESRRIFGIIRVLGQKKVGGGLGLAGQSPSKNSNRFRIYISAKSLPILRTLVQSHFHPTMLYKLGI